ncbi:dihydrolipoyllysine-residue acetyltransferase [Pseudomaricurvus alkylphenolicus]|uniref:2-oxo acid dehydrogenase subunit E2 n=1 Tax=Pseudomaricurvus alkylphenolicus TaxID=1306991 RepID=UPI001421AF73|nr:2-oxo acid dehydrogenase subunit E2 [Pseudomaricurvus alkylphenolicus]NIB43589.1 dihydrolipoyllysine-residue acetyltransferase [Pseudomaricurvus alkylphenolicus]
MNVDFILPDIGEGIVECEIVEWRVKEGDRIEEDQPVADVSTDKAVVEIPSVHSGQVVKLYYQEGDIAKVHTPLFAISIDAQAGGEPSANKGPSANEVPSANKKPSADKEPLTPASLPPSDTDTSPKAVTSIGKVLTTPAVRRIAREQNLDLTLVPATGKNGRVLKEDVLRYLEAPVAETGTTVPTQGAAQPVKATDRVEPIKGVRAVMAKSMMESVSTIPHFTYVDEVDITRLIDLRLQLKEQYAEQGIRITMMPLFMKTLSLALLEFPIMNSSPNNDFTELRYIAGHNIGMAVDSKIGLLVPNAKNVQDLSIMELAQELNRLTESARSGKVAPADLKGGTITISNVGAIGGTAATPIINKPEVAIVALGKVQELPRFDADGNVVARKIMSISWSGDHRVIDGGTIARFSNRWKEFLEDPTAMLMAMR